MQEIRCPNCGKTFMVDDTGYAQIAQQVRDSEFDRALRQREKDIAEAKERELELARMRQKEAFDQALGEREKRIEQLSAQLTGSETEKRLAVTEAMGNYTVRTQGNKVVLSSATSPENPFYTSAEKLSPHVGHADLCDGYGDDE